MEKYLFWREFAASWGTLYFAVIFFAALAYALWPSKQQDFDAAAQIPLTEDKEQ
ncbi:MAG: cbb3-type cytochrome c oxidase subunit 3 [Hyphomicrobiales bacterium]|nr:cbb3-type cytochrome c oxidase subunit 3 [Hyphomicrobiales bacterium]